MGVFGFRRFGPHGNLDIAAQSVQKFEQAAERIVAWMLLAGLLAV